MGNGESNASDAPKPDTSSKSSASAREPNDLTAAQLARAMSIHCKEANAAINKVRDAYRGGSSDVEDLDRIAEAFDEARTVSEAAERKLAALRPGPSEREAFDRYMRSLRRQHQLSDAMASALRDRDIEGYRRLKVAKERNTRQRCAAAAELGAEGCGKT